jgi:hypothetical protein
MKKELRDKFYGQAVDKWIEKLPGELPVDAVGLWQIASFGREGFGLSGEELITVVRRGIAALLAKGAVPVIGAMDGIHTWTPVNYGDTAGEISEAIITEWRDSGREPDVGDVWFALPHILEATLPPNEPRKRKEDLSVLARDKGPRDGRNAELLHSIGGAARGGSDRSATVADLRASSIERRP